MKRHAKPIALVSGYTLGCRGAYFILSRNLWGPCIRLAGRWRLKSRR
jgi:hypothetical protein